MELPKKPRAPLDAQPSWWREAMTQSCRDGVGGWSTPMVGGSLSRRGTDVENRRHRFRHRP